MFCFFQTPIFNTHVDLFVSLLRWVVTRACLASNSTLDYFLSGCSESWKDHETEESAPNPLAFGSMVAARFISRLTSSPVQPGRISAAMAPLAHLARFCAGSQKKPIDPHGPPMALGLQDP